MQEKQRRGERAASEGEERGVQSGNEGRIGAPGGSRRWSSGARASTRLCLLAEVEDGGAPGGLANSARPVGWAVLGQAR